MQVHEITVRLRVEADNDIDREDVVTDLRRQLSVIQEQAPYRSIHGVGWWTNSRDAVRID